MKSKPAYATPMVHFYDGSHWTKDGLSKTPCSKIYGEPDLEQANDSFRLTDNLEEVTCPRCFQVMEGVRQEGEPRTKWEASLKLPNPVPKEVRRRVLAESRRQSLVAAHHKIRRLLMGALTLVSLKRRR